MVKYEIKKRNLTILYVIYLRYLFFVIIIAQLMRRISWHILDSKRIDQNFNCLLNVFATYLFICIVVCNKKTPNVYD